MPTRAFFYAPHPDDETLSMGLAIIFHIMCGYHVHLISMSKGGVTPESVKLTGGQNCGWHGYRHDNVRENYTVPTQADIAEIRFRETASAFGAMSTGSMVSGIAPGELHHEFGGLPDLYGGGGATGTPPTQAGIDAAQEVMQMYVTNYPNSLHFTMSESDRHPDHAALGYALRNLKNADPMLVNSRFFVSRLYWNTGSGYPPEVLDAANGTLQWYGTGNTTFGTKKAEMDSILRNRVSPIFSAWNPAEGSYAIGYHQVVNQFATNFGPSASIANLIHA
jgi:LmbE family N-acetylglucosaminyl deacetylase